MLKQLTALWKNFVKLTNSTNWEDSVAQLPLFACKSELKKLIALDLSKEIPKSFLVFCKRAKSTKDARALNGSLDPTYVHMGELLAMLLKKTHLS